MFKFRPKKSVKSIDSIRSRRIQLRLTRLSVQRRKQQLTSLKHPEKRGVTKLTISGRLNKRGTLAGMHNHTNPPSSEHMKKIRAMRKIYNRQMPVLQCSNCAFATSCPQFKAGFECAYLPYLNSHSVENDQDLMEAMKNLCEASLSRVHREAMMETLTGGKPSLETSEAMNMAFMQLKTLHDKMMEQDGANVTLETEDGTIIGRLFGGLGDLVEHTEQSYNNPINAAPILNDERETKALPESTEEVNLALIREHTKDELASLTGKRTKEKGNTALKAIVISTLKKT